MSLRKILGKVLILGVLEIGALCGVRISAEEIERLLNVMNRVQVVQVVKKEGP